MVDANMRVACLTRDATRFLEEFNVCNGQASDLTALAEKELNITAPPSADTRSLKMVVTLLGHCDVHSRRGQSRYKSIMQLYIKAEA